MCTSEFNLQAAYTGWERKYDELERSLSTYGRVERETENGGEVDGGENGNDLHSTIFQVLI